MEIIFYYLVAGVVLAWAADGHSPLSIKERLAIIAFWLPGCILLGIISRTEGGRDGGSE
jgi:hypothetical protein